MRSPQKSRKRSECQRGKRFVSTLACNERVFHLEGKFHVHSPLVYLQPVPGCDVELRLTTTRHLEHHVMRQMQPSI